MINTSYKIWDGEDYVSKPFTLMDLQTGKIQFTSDCVLLPCIGIKDCKGNSVYAGDICFIGGLGLALVEVSILKGGLFITKYGEEYPIREFIGHNSEFIQIKGNFLNQPQEWIDL